MTKEIREINSYIASVTAFYPKLIVISDLATSHWFGPAGTLLTPCGLDGGWTQWGMAAAKDTYDANKVYLNTTADGQDGSVLSSPNPEECVYLPP